MVNVQSLALYVEDDRQQRAAYHIARCGLCNRGALSKSLAASRTHAKHLDQFSRRARGMAAAFHRPYLGCREFPADFALVESDADMPRYPNSPAPGSTISAGCSMTSSTS